MASSRPRIGIVMKSFLGDSIMATPLFFGLDRSGFDPIGFALAPASKLLLNRVPGTIVEISKAKSYREILAQAQLLKSYNLDGVILVNRSFRSALVARMAGVRIRSGHSTEHRKPLLTYSTRYEAFEPEYKCYCELAKPFAESVEFGLPELLGSSEFGSARKKDTRKVVAIQPGARYDSKRIPMNLLIEVGNYLQSKGFLIKIVGGQDERICSEELETHLSAKVQNLTGETTIEELTNELANVDFAIGSDTGVMHIAAALQVPTLTVFGPNPASKWGHHYFPHVVIQAKDGNLDNVTFEQMIEALIPMTESNKYNFVTA